MWSVDDSPGNEHFSTLNQNCSRAPESGINVVDARQKSVRPAIVRGNIKLLRIADFCRRFCEEFTTLTFTSS